MRKNFVNYFPWEISSGLLILLVAILLLPFLYIFFTSAIVSSFQKLGFSFASGMLIFLSTLVGSAVNIPVGSVASGREVIVEKQLEFFGIRYRIPVIERAETLISVNLGGAVIPVLISLYELIRLVAFGSLWTFFSLLLSIAFVTFGVNRFARLVPGFGIAIPIFIPPLLTVLSVLILRPVFPPAVAYISGTIGTLLGADLLNLGKIKELGSPIVSIGGAGTFDGIFLTGIISVLLI